MKTKEHRPGIHEGYLMSRKLKLEGLTDQSRQSIVDQIDQIKGVDSVSIVDQQDLLLVSYDGSQMGIDQIEEVVQAHGCHFVSNWWSRMKLGWYRSADQNVKDNAAHVPTCCSKPPRR